MKYQVLENNVPCSELAKMINLDPSWHQDTFDDALMAEFYASAWACGRMRGHLPSIWKQLMFLPFAIEVDTPKFIGGVDMTIKSIKE